VKRIHYPVNNGVCTKVRVYVCVCERAGVCVRVKWLPHRAFPSAQISLVLIESQAKSKEFRAKTEK